MAWRRPAGEARYATHDRAGLAAETLEQRGGAADDRGDRGAVQERAVDVSEQRSVTVAIACAVTAALLRLIPLHWLHPVNWDEIEFYCATKWIAEGRLPFRDFWE